MASLRVLPEISTFKGNLSKTFKYIDNTYLHQIGITLMKKDAHLSNEVFDVFNFNCFKNKIVFKPLPGL